MADSKISALTAITTFAGTEELVAASSGTTKKITAANLMNAAGGFTSAWTTVVKGSDQSISANTVLTDDTALFFTATNNAVYQVQAFIIYACPLSGGTPDLKVAFGEDTTIRGLVSLLGFSVSDAGAIGHIKCDQGTSSTNVFGTATGQRALVGDGHYVGAGGTFKYQWCQNISDANPVTTYTGSILRYRRII